MTSVKFEPDDSLFQEPVEPEPFPVVSRDVPLQPRASRPVTPPVPAVEDVATRALRVGDILKPPSEPAPSQPAPAAETHAENGASPPPASREPQGRALADLYFAQGHFAEALRIYDELVAANSLDEELRRMRREAEARLLPAGSTPGAAAADPALERRLAKIRALKQWLSVVQTG